MIFEGSTTLYHFAWVFWPKKLKKNMQRNLKKHEFDGLELIIYTLEILKCVQRKQSLFMKTHMKCHRTVCLYLVQHMIVLIR